MVPPNTLLGATPPKGARVLLVEGGEVWVLWPNIKALDDDAADGGGLPNKPRPPVVGCEVEAGPAVVVVSPIEGGGGRQVLEGVIKGFHVEG